MAGAVSYVTGHQEDGQKIQKGISTMTRSADSRGSQPTELSLVHSADSRDSSGHSRVPAVTGGTVGTVRDYPGAVKPKAAFSGPRDGDLARIAIEIQMRIQAVEVHIGRNSAPVQHQDTLHQACARHRHTEQKEQRST